MDKEKHRKLIVDTLNYINAATASPFVLKGGTALMLAYGLDRFSEDVDLDAPGGATSRDLFFSLLDDFCDEKGLSVRKAKDTETVGRVFIHYGHAQPLKVEVSYRKAEIPESAVNVVDGIKVYTLDEICQMKCSAYLARDKMRDLFDVTFICTEHYNELNEASRGALRNAFEYKDLGQLDYLLRTSEDVLVDEGILVDRFLRSYETVGLLVPSGGRANRIAAPKPKTKDTPSVDEDDKWLRRAAGQQKRAPSEAARRSSSR